jgi:hypothetical protein
MRSAKLSSYRLMKNVRTLLAGGRYPGAAVLALGLTAFAFPLIASAQGPELRPSYATDEEVVRGRIVSFDGQYSLELQDERGFIDQVRLRQSTIVHPIGLRLRSGMTVTIVGINQGSVLAANEIDRIDTSNNTAYAENGSPDFYPPYYPVYYPYPVYGYAYPRVDAAFVFNFGFFHGNFRHFDHFHHFGRR